MKLLLAVAPLLLAACAATPLAPTKPAATTSTAPATATPVPVSIANLGAWHWQLQRATRADGTAIEALSVPSRLPLQLDFTAQRIHVSHTCNAMGGGYTVRNQRIDIGPMAHTLMACADPALTAMDDAAASRLEGSLQWTLAGTPAAPRLTLRTDAGDTLAFDGTPTAQTRYGSAGETRFLEVAAQTVPCGTDADAGQCLHVREVHYDANGLRRGAPGAWRVQRQPIEGYTHTAGTRNILRVKRYSLPAPETDAAWVLDMVVESALTP